MRPRSGTVMRVVSIEKSLLRPGVREAVWSVAWESVPPRPLPIPCPGVRGPGSCRECLVLAVSSRRRACRLGPFNPRPGMGSGSSPGSKRNVVLYPLFHAPDFLDQVGEVAAMLHEVDVRAVDHEKWGLC